MLRNCVQHDYLCCSIFSKCCHRSCLKMSKKHFTEISRYETHMFVCSDKCESVGLPFKNVSNKVFQDTNVGKRKFPCKTCFGECKNFPNSIQCPICMKWQHLDCLSSYISKNVFPSSIPYFFMCSTACEMRLAPFYELSNLELHNEI